MSFGQEECRASRAARAADVLASFCRSSRSTLSRSASSFFSVLMSSLWCARRSRGGDGLRCAALSRARRDEIVSKNNTDSSAYLNAQSRLLSAKYDCFAFSKVLHLSCTPQSESSEYDARNVLLSATLQSPSERPRSLAANFGSWMMRLQRFPHRSTPRQSASVSSLFHLPLPCKQASVSDGDSVWGAERRHTILTRRLSAAAGTSQMRVQTPDARLRHGHRTDFFKNSPLSERQNAAGRPLELTFDNGRESARLSKMEGSETDPRERNSGSDGSGDDEGVAHHHEGGELELNENEAHRHGLAVFSARPPLSQSRSHDLPLQQSALLHSTQTELQFAPENVLVHIAKPKQQEQQQQQQQQHQQQPPLKKARLRCVVSPRPLPFRTDASVVASSPSSMR